MAEIKATSFRVLEEDLDKFKAFAAENDLNQAEAFTSILNTFEIARAKNQISDRAKEIETFQDTLNTISTMFINSLSVNQTSEQRIREQLSLELNTKDQTIADLQTERNELKDKSKSTDDYNKELIKSNKDLEEDIKRVKAELDTKSIANKNLEEQIATLNEIVTEYKEFKDKNKKLEETNKALLEENAAAKNINKDLESKLKNADEICSFYKEQLESYKEEIKEINKTMDEKEKSYKLEIREAENKLNDATIKFNAEIRAIDEKNDNELAKIKEEYKKDVETQIKAKEEDLNNRLNLEKEKMQLEIDKLNLKSSKENVRHKKEPQSKEN